MFSDRDQSILLGEKTGDGGFSEDRKRRECVGIKSKINLT